MVEENEKLNEENAQEETPLETAVKNEPTLELIIGKTYARFAEMTEEEVVSALGFPGETTEEDAIRFAQARLLIAMSKDLVVLETDLMKMSEVFKGILLGKQFGDTNTTKED